MYWCLGLGWGGFRVEREISFVLFSWYLGGSGASVASRLVCPVGGGYSLCDSIVLVELFSKRRLCLVTRNAGGEGSGGWDLFNLCYAGINDYIIIYISTVRYLTFVRACSLNPYDL